MFDWRLISAEVLKLRHRRGMLAISILLTLGLSLVVFAVMGIQHASNPARYGPAGGEESYSNALSTLTVMAFVVGTIVGATAGTQDIESGVFRDLAATGRSRAALFGARVMGAWAIALPILAAMMAAQGILGIVLADAAPGPHTGTIVAATAAILIAGALSAAVAVGLSALVGSRGTAIGGLLAFFLAIQPLLSLMGFLGTVRQGLPLVAIDRIGHMPGPNDVSIALGTAIAVPIAWCILTLALGAWKTATREI
jgi:hypothetical protein